MDQPQKLQQDVLTEKDQINQFLTFNSQNEQIWQINEKDVKNYASHDKPDG